MWRWRCLRLMLRRSARPTCKHLIEGSETVSAITEASGAYLIEVRSP